MAKRVVILSDRMGSGDDELGRLLMRNFLYSLARADSPPSAVMLSNGGVRLACDGSGSLDDLALLAERGVAVRSCGTCLDYLGLLPSLAVGGVGAMPDLVAAICGDDTIVTIA